MVRILKLKKIGVAYGLLYRDMKKPDEDGRRYQAYLLRCWNENGEWRFTVEPISQGRERVPIANMSGLIDYLQQKLYLPADFHQNNTRT